MMNVTWELSPADVKRLRAFVDSQRGNPFVQYRLHHNVENPPQEIDISHFWEVLVGCLLTSQQRSGPDGAVTRFLNTKPFPLRYERLKDWNEMEEGVRTVLTEFGGIRFVNRLANWMSRNHDILDSGLWEEAQQTCHSLIGEDSAEQERLCAKYMADRFVGIGPKQSRNLLQGLGLTKYEIPIDSRITRWLNEFGLPVTLTAGALSDPNNYNFVMDGIQEMCRQADVLPCVLDAAIFSSYDGDGWTDENVVW